MFPHTDNFNRADQSGLGSDWNTIKAGWDIVSNRARVNFAANFPLTQFKKPFQTFALGTDYCVRCKLYRGTATDGTTAGIVGRMIIKTNTFYYGYVALVRKQAGTDEIELYRFNNADPAGGGFVQLGSDAVEEWADGDELILKMKGNVISVWRKSGAGSPVQKITYTETSTDPEINLVDVMGSAGMRSTSSGWEFEDFTVDFIGTDLGEAAVVKNVCHVRASVTSSTARIAFGVSHASTVKVEYATNVNFTGSTITSGVAVDSTTDFTGKIDISSLTPDTTYYYRILIDDVPRNIAYTGVIDVPKFRTFATSSSNVNFEFVFGSCINRNSDNDQAETNFAAILARTNTRFVHVGGDNDYADHWPYASITATLQAYRDSFRESLASYRNRSYRKVREQYPGFVMWDDHEIINDCNPTDHAGYYAIASPAYKEHLGRVNPDSMQAGELYYAWNHGNVGFFALDGRSFRSRQSDVDTPSKTILGATQKQHLKDWLLTNNSTYRIKFIISSTPVNGYTGHLTGNDAWGAGYLSELYEILDYIRAQRIRGVIFLTSDQHWVGAFRKVSKGGASRGMQFYEFQSTPLGAFVLGSPSVTSPEILFKDHSYNANHGVVTVNTTLADAQITFTMYGHTGAQIGTVTVYESQLANAVLAAKDSTRDDPFDNTGPTAITPSRAAAHDNTAPSAITPARAAAHDNTAPAPTKVFSGEIAVRVASTANVNIGSTLDGQTIDGVVVSQSEFVLLKNQSNPAQNGVYEVDIAPQPPFRTPAFDSAAELHGGCRVRVTEGATNAGKRFILTTPPPIVLGTTALAFTEVGSGTKTNARTAPFDNTGPTAKDAGLRDDPFDNTAPTAITPGRAAPWNNAPPEIRPL